MSRIFISIASYQDPTLIRTIRSAITTADNPDKLVFGLGIQHDELPDLDEFDPKQIRMLYWKPEDRPGLIRVRYLLSKLYENEDYFLMTDSHMTFKSGWDTKLIHHINSLGPKTILMPQTPMGEVDKFVNDQEFRFVQYKNRVPWLADGMAGWLKDYDILPVPSDGNSSTFDLLQKTTSWRSGCIFTYGNFVTEVGFDPYSHTSHEESYMSYRSYMSGWDTYQLNDDIIEHTPEEYYAVNWTDDMAERVTTTSRYEESLYTTNYFSLAYIYNDYSKYAIKNAVRNPIDYWKANGQEDFYHYIKMLADQDLFNNEKI